MTMNGETGMDHRTIRTTIRQDRRLEHLRNELEEQAQVFEDPGAYLAGVEDVFAAIGPPRPLGPDVVVDLEAELPPQGGWFG